MPPEGLEPSLLTESGFESDVSTDSTTEASLPGVEGLEPPNDRAKTCCLTTWPHPNGLVCDSIAQTAALGQWGCVGCGPWAALAAEDYREDPRPV